MRRLRHGTLRCPQPELVAVLRGRATSHTCLMVILSRAEGTSRGYSTLLVAYSQPQALLLLYVPFTPTTWSPDCSHSGVGILVCLLMFCYFKSCLPHRPHSERVLDGQWFSEHIPSFPDSRALNGMLSC